MHEQICTVLYEDNHLLVVAKPPGLATLTGTGTHSSVHRWAQAYLRHKYGKPGRVYVGLVHRLDKPVSGVMVLARTSKAARRLTEQFRTGKVKKIYWAVVEGIFPDQRGTLQHWLQKDKQRGYVRVESEDRAGSRLALLYYERKAVGRGLSWLELRPQTGRTHQLRAQLADRGHPIYGDRKYGSRHGFGPAIALHAYSLAFEHPVRHEQVVFVTAPPAIWRCFSHLGIPLDLDQD
ncbi:MAG: RNA pseudouridine synthase [Gemmatales bacterium]|nr:RNA pseudouridine synthase [Gemmatales bacterium]MDW8223767.1 RNA pseudouridine synthase [Gemmatales bacterium]